MRITWEVEDGYCGKSRPQHTEVDDEDLKECATDKEREALIQDAIQEDFTSRIAWYEVSRK